MLFIYLDFLSNFSHGQFPPPDSSCHITQQLPFRECEGHHVLPPAHIMPVTTTLCTAAAILLTSPWPRMAVAINSQSLDDRVRAFLLHHLGAFNCIIKNFK